MALIALSGCAQQPQQPTATETVKTTVEAPADNDNGNDNDNPDAQQAGAEEQQGPELSASGDGEQTCLDLVGGKPWWNERQEFSFTQGTNARPKVFLRDMFEKFSSPGVVCQAGVPNSGDLNEWGYFELTPEDREAVLSAMKGEPGVVPNEQEGRTVYKVPSGDAETPERTAHISLGEDDMIFATTQTVWDNIIDL